MVRNGNDTKWLLYEMTSFVLNGYPCTKEEI